MDNLSKIGSFIFYYLKSGRLYYAFVTLTAGWVGVAMYQSESTCNVFNKIITLTIMFVGWGVNQIINDYMGLKEDRINAPDRPMVSGKLQAKPALLLSSIIILMAVIWSFCQTPLSLIPLLGGVLMNIVYSYAKGYGIYGNLAFGLSISACTWYSYVVLGGSLCGFFNYWRILAAVVLFNMIMTYFTYFKDYLGDKEAGKNTLVVKWGLEKASNMGVLFSFVPAIILGALYDGDRNFLISAILASSLFILTGILFKKENDGKNTYFNLKYNFAALSASQACLVCHLGRSMEGLVLAICSIIWVIVIFSLGYRNEKA